MQKHNFITLMDILNCWCNASGAKFNKSKTKIIPIGSEKFCQKLRTSRILSD
ncbi:hypothetical protein BDR03DRAFT_867183 [Suillus americanus]|nr:hypothetical protein BDR03DRAFT_867183 [Suillus americanus]